MRLRDTHTPPLEYESRCIISHVVGAQPLSPAQQQLLRRDLAMEGAAGICSSRPSWRFTAGNAAQEDGSSDSFTFDMHRANRRPLVQRRWAVPAAGVAAPAGSANPNVPITTAPVHTDKVVPWWQKAREAATVPVNLGQCQQGQATIDIADLPASPKPEHPPPHCRYLAPKSPSAFAATAAAAVAAGAIDTTIGVVHYPAGPASPHAGASYSARSSALLTAKDAVAPVRPAESLTPTFSLQHNSPSTATRAPADMSRRTHPADTAEPALHPDQHCPEYLQEHGPTGHDAEPNTPAAMDPTSLGRPSPRVSDPLRCLPVSSRWMEYVSEG